MSGPSEKKQKSPTKKNDALPESELSNSFADRIGGLLQKFDRFTWDVVGVILIAFSLVTVLALAGLTKGVLLDPWRKFLLDGLGSGSYPAFVLIGWLGVWILRRRMEKTARLNLGRVLALEGLVFVAMAFLSLINGNALDRAAQGQDGGVVGWGLAKLVSLLLPLPWSTILLIVLGVWFLLIGFGVMDWIAGVVSRWLASPLPEVDLAQIPLPEPEAAPSTNGADKKKGISAEGGIPIPVVASRREENLPPLTLLTQEEENGIDEDRILAVAKKIEKTLAEFGVPSHVAGYRVGPAITQFAVEPGFIEKTGPDGSTVRQKVRSLANLQPFT